MTDPISDEAITRLVKAFYEAHGVESWESSAEYRYGAEHHWMREAFAAIVPLLVSAEVERLRTELDSERTARARDLVRYSQDAMFLRLSAAEAWRDEALDVAEGLRAELADAERRCANALADLLAKDAALAALRAAGGQEKPSDAEDVECVTCRAEVGQPCRVLLDMRYTRNPHAARRAASAGLPFEPDDVPAAPVGGQEQEKPNDATNWHNWDCNRTSCPGCYDGPRP